MKYRILLLLFIMSFSNIFAQNDNFLDTITLDKIKRIYKVSEKTVIKDTQWDKLENTEDNRITLITCVENRPELRRCIQAKEI